MIADSFYARSTRKKPCLAFNTGCVASDLQSGAHFWRDDVKSGGHYSFNFSTALGQISNEKRPHLVLVENSVDVLDKFFVNRVELPCCASEDSEWIKVVPLIAEGLKMEVILLSSKELAICRVVKKDQKYQVKIKSVFQFSDILDQVEPMIFESVIHCDSLLFLASKLKIFAFDLEVKCAAEIYKEPNESMNQIIAFSAYKSTAAAYLACGDLIIIDASNLDSPKAKKFTMHTNSIWKSCFMHLVPTMKDIEIIVGLAPARQMVKGSFSTVQRWTIEKFEDDIDQSNLKFICQKKFKKGEITCMSSRRVHPELVVIGFYSGNVYMLNLENLSLIHKLKSDYPTSPILNATIHDSNGKVDCVLTNNFTADISLFYVQRIEESPKIVPCLFKTAIISLLMMILYLHATFVFDY